MPSVPAPTQPISGNGNRADPVWYRWWKAVSDLLDTTVGGTSAFMTKAANLSDVTTPATARNNIGRPKGHLWGFSLTNSAGDLTNDIDFGTGVCRDSLDGVDIIAASGYTKQLDAAWAAGTAAGGKMSAAAIANTTYHLFVIYNPTSGLVDFGFDTSPTAPTLPTGYTKFRRIGSLVRESATIVKTLFVRFGGGNLRAIRDVPLSDYSTANPTTVAITVTHSIPTGIVIDALFAGELRDDTPAAGTNLIFTSLDQTATAPTLALHDLRISASGATVPATADSQFRRKVNANAQTRFQLGASNVDITVSVMGIGWEDDCGVSA